jgi:xanthine dehydrogenase YagS FAD-binding subunit
MRPFTYESLSSVKEAASRSGSGSAFIAGGTTMVDLMKLEVLTPEQLVDITQLPMRGIELGADGLRIGAMERMSDVAAHSAVLANYPVVAESLLKSASPQIRNMASIGGNLLQRTRCGYFRDISTPCNKREPGSGCSAFDGENRNHAIFGTSALCVATHPSDLAVALVALDAELRLESGAGGRVLKLDDFYLLPGETPEKENVLAPGELITEVRIPRLDWARKSTYLKVRDRESYEFALTSAAVALNIDGDQIRDARVAVGGVGTKPWRLPAVAQSLVGKSVNRETFTQAAALAAEGAKPLRHNRYKIELVQRTITRALMNLGGSV